ncbi:MAG: hypothetical protein ACR2KG_11820 [Nocardioidaceae bacterium]
MICISVKFCPDIEIGPLFCAVLATAWLTRLAETLPTTRLWEPPEPRDPKSRDTVPRISPDELLVLLLPEEGWIEHDELLLLFDELLQAAPARMVPTAMTSAVVCRMLIPSPAFCVP